MCHCNRRLLYRLNSGTVNGRGAGVLCGEGGREGGGEDRPAEEEDENTDETRLCTAGNPRRRTNMKERTKMRGRRSGIPSIPVAAPPPNRISLVWWRRFICFPLFLTHSLTQVPRSNLTPKNRALRKIISPWSRLVWRTCQK